MTLWTNTFSWRFKRRKTVGLKRSGLAANTKPIVRLSIWNVLVCFCDVCSRRSIMTDLYYLSQADGVGEWRMKEAKDLSDLVQNRITYLQVPTCLPAALEAIPTYTHKKMESHHHLLRLLACHICTLHEWWLSAHTPTHTHTSHQEQVRALIVPPLEFDEQEPRRLPASQWRGENAQQPPDGCVQPATPPLPAPSRPGRGPHSINETIRLMKRSQLVWLGGDGAANSCCHHR